jgi:hypothetical protein
VNNLMEKSFDAWLVQLLELGQVIGWDAFLNE